MTIQSECLSVVSDTYPVRRASYTGHDKYSAYTVLMDDWQISYPELSRADLWSGVGEKTKMGKKKA